MSTPSLTVDFAINPIEYRSVLTAVRRNSLRFVAGTGLVVGYLVYIFFSFNFGALIEKSRPERALLLATDAFAYKIHVTKFLRGNTDVSIAVEGERTATYKTPPDWVVQSGDVTTVDLEDGYSVEVKGNSLTMVVPDVGLIRVMVTTRGVETRLPEGIKIPAWLRFSPVKFEARPTIGRRVQVSKSRIEVHRYFLGWENFFFPFRSELSTYSGWGILKLAFSDRRLQPDMSNLKLIFSTIWYNQEWQHRHVFIALLETLLMAVLGTFTAALVGLPLAFLAATNFTPFPALRFAMRRLFDFLRGIDMLIWSLIFIRAFGLGPLTGALAIAFTDTGTLGKLFSEALEGADNKQMEGVNATGANRLQFYRFGVIPQIIPIFVSQGLYYLESNVRSATIIGALGAGGIGLLLVETMNTQRDWENTLYIIILTICLVMVMDALSSKLRNRLIHGGRDQS
ncbi:phosphonate ABC transporter, permease protein PhnE [bacterium]|nr:phosphonate ABC transporter, permease protein PhnE [bacterium]